MCWLAELEQPDQRHGQWVDHLHSLGIDVVEQHGMVFVRFDDLDEIEDSSEVNDQMTKRLHRLDIAFRLALDEVCPIHYKKLYKIREGRLIGKVFLGHAKSTSRAYPINQKENKAERVQIAASLGPSVLDDDLTQEILDRLDLPTTPVTLYNVYDLILINLGGGSKNKGIEEAINNAWISEDDCDRFQRSVQDPRLSGLEARHYKFDKEPCPDPMDLSEMQVLINDLAGQFLRFRGQQLSLSALPPTPHSSRASPKTIAPR